MKLPRFPDRELTLNPADFVPTDGSPVSFEDQYEAWARQRAREAGFRLTHDEATGWNLAEPAEIIRHVDGFISLRQWTAPEAGILRLVDVDAVPLPVEPAEPESAEAGPAWLHLTGGARVLLSDTSPARFSAALRPAAGEPAFVAQGEPTIERDGDGWRLVMRLSPFTNPGPAGI